MINNKRIELMFKPFISERIDLNLYSFEKLI